MAVALMFAVYGCEDKGDEDDGTTSSPTTYTPPTGGDRYVSSLDIESHIASQQPIDGAAPYPTGNPPYKLEAQRVGSYGIFYGSGDPTRRGSSPSLPSTWTGAFKVNDLQLVLVLSQTTSATGRTSLYVGSGTATTYELYHVTVSAELREAATWGLVASSTFGGDNSFPGTDGWARNGVVYDMVDSNAIEAWLTPYVAQ